MKTYFDETFKARKREEALISLIILQALYIRRMKQVKMFFVILGLTCLALVLIAMVDSSLSSSFAPAVAGLQ